MPRGRKPKPTALKKLQGNPGKRKLKANEPQPAPIALLPAGKKKANVVKTPAEFRIDRLGNRADNDGWMPPDAAGEAARAYKVILAELSALGVVTTIDEPLLKAFCQAFGVWREASAMVNRYGLIVRSPNGSLIQSPHLPIVNKQAAIMAKIGSEFGLSPIARTRLGTEEAPKEDAFLAFLNRRREKDAQA